LTAILQVKLGYLIDNAHAWQLTRQLIEEAVVVANADGQNFDANQITEEVRQILINARDGYTSIYADIRDGKRTEVDTISGAVVRKAGKLGVPAPNLGIVVDLIHAMEEKP
jgi:2-dehydropantoate 2-reductase